MTELTCKELVELVTDYLEDTLPAGDRARFEEHVSMCEGCQMYIDQMRDMLTLLGSLSTDSLSPDAERELRAAFRGWRDGDGGGGA